MNILLQGLLLIQNYFFSNPWYYGYSYRKWIFCSRVYYLFKITFFQTHDITDILKWDNLLEITVADGWYKGRVGLAGIGHQFGEKTALLSQIEIEYENGEKEFIVTDNTFKASTGEIVYSDLFIGEKQDKNREKTMVEVIEKDFGYDNLLPDMAEPIICKDKIQAVRILEAPNGDKIVDFGKNNFGNRWS